MQVIRKSGDLSCKSCDLTKRGPVILANDAVIPHCVEESIRSDFCGGRELNAELIDDSPSCCIMPRDLIAEEVTNVHFGLSQ